MSTTISRHRSRSLFPLFSIRGSDLFRRHLLCSEEPIRNQGNFAADNPPLSVSIDNGCRSCFPARNLCSTMNSTDADTLPRTRAPSNRIKVKNATPTPPKTKKSNKEYLQKHRDSIKADEQKYKAHCKAESERMKRQRENWSEEQKQRHRELQRERQRKYREKKKLEERTPAELTSPRMTRCMKDSQEKRREGNRASAQKMRDNYSHQKRQAINKKRRQRYWKKKEEMQSVKSIPHPIATSTPVGLQETHKHTAPYPTYASYKSAVYRMKQKLGNIKGERMAQTIKGIIRAQDTPTKAALRALDVCISPTSTKLKAVMTNVVKDLSTQRDKTSIATKRKLLSSFPDDIRENFQPQQKKRKKPLNSLYSRSCPKREIAEECLLQFATYLPSKKTASAKTEIQKQILSESVSSIHKKVRAKHNVSLRSLYRHKPKHIISSHKAKFRQCLCDIFFNAQSKMRTLNMFLTEKLDVSDMLSLTMCKTKCEQFPPIDCVRRECGQCGCDRVKDEFVRKLEDGLETHVAYSAWKIVKEGGKSRMEKLLQRVTLRELLDELFAELKPLALHQFNSRWQRDQYKLLKANIPKEAVVLTLDFAENYLCKVQDEAQSAYWSYTQVSVHPVVATFKCPSCNDNIVHHLVFLSDDLKHDSHIVNLFYKKTLSHLMSLMSLQKIFVFSDGAASQYKSKTPFYYLASSAVPAEKVFYGSRHGKSECDAVGGTVKSLLTTLAASQPSLIMKDANTVFQECLQRFKKYEEGACGFPHKSREFFLVKSEEVDRTEPENIKAIPGTRSLHHIKVVAKNTFATRKLACFCGFCLSREGTECENKKWIDDWEFVKMNGAAESESENEERQDCENVVENAPERESVPAEKMGERVKVGSFYLVQWHGKDYVAQVKDKDESLARLSFMKWKNGQLMWGGDDFSWETFDCIGPEVKLTLNERASNQRVQVFTYSFVTTFL